MTGDEPASKRRRLDAARTTLRKPFKSPLVKRPGDPSRTAFEGTKKAFASASRSPGTLVVRARGTAVRGRTVDGSPAAKAVSEKDRKHEILTLLSRRKKEIENQTRELRQRLDLVKQAHSIESASSRKRPDGEVDAELRQLIQKWKKASCSAASELFDLIKERVESMGGAKAWKATQQRQPDLFDEGRQSGHQGFQNREEETVDEDDTSYAAGKNLPSQDQDGSKFTMAMMLQSLDIEPGTLGLTSDDMDGHS